MSPASQLKHKQNRISERNNDKIKLCKYEKTEVTLADEQHDDMCNVMNTIEVVTGKRSNQWNLVTIRIGKERVFLYL